MFFGKVKDISKPVWAMVIVTDRAEEMTAERLRESAFKIFRKMGWDSPEAGTEDAHEG